MAIQKGPSGALGTSIEAGEIATGAITEDKIGSGAVTASKIQNNIALPGTSATINGYTPTVSNMTGRNRIINGDMRINQRGASVTTAGTYVTDRWQWDSNTTSATLTFAQSSTAPTGFTNSLGITVGTADTSIAAGDLVDFRHWIEGNNVADFGLGTASAVTFTVSFWVRSSVTGTYGASFRNSDASRVYVSTFVINAANTWEYKTITVAGDTTGTWYTDNQRGLGMNICLAGGSNYQTTAGVWTAAGNYRTTSAQANFLATNGATFYITGVQLEKGSVATPFDYRQYGTELALCQRYYAKLSGGGFSNFNAFAVGFASNSTTVEGIVIYPVSMRATATVSFSNVRTNTAVGSNTAVTSISNTYAGTNTANVVFISSGSTMTQGQGATIVANNNSSGYLDLSAEL